MSFFFYKGDGFYLFYSSYCEKNIHTKVCVVHFRLFLDFEKWSFAVVKKCVLTKALIILIVYQNRNYFIQIDNFLNCCQTIENTICEKFASCKSMCVTTVFSTLTAKPIKSMGLFVENQLFLWKTFFAYFRHGQEMQ